MIKKLSYCSEREKLLFRKKMCVCAGSQNSKQCLCVTTSPTSSQPPHREYLDKNGTAQARLVSTDKFIKPIRACSLAKAPAGCAGAVHTLNIFK